MTARRELMHKALVFAAILISATFGWLVSRSRDQRLAVSAGMLAKLGELRNQPKYVHEPGTSYNGMRPETDRQRAEAQLNELIDRLQQNLATAPMKTFVLGEFSNTLAQFEPVDTEDRERLCRYLEEIMNILGIESSGGLLNRWLYGPILSSALPSQRQTN